MPGPSQGTKKSVTFKILQVKLKGLQDIFDNIYKFVETLHSASVSASDVKVRLERIDDSWENVNSAIMELEVHDDYDAAEYDYAQDRATFADRYYTAKARLMDKARQLEDGISLNSTIVGLETSQHPTVEHVRLPQIKLQTFDGNVDEWLSFRDLYTSLIHCKPDLPEIEKFHYLKGCLAGEAKALVDPFPITRANYQIAWDTMTKHYNDSKLLRRRQVQTLFNLPTLVKESGAELQSLLESFERAVNTLDQLVTRVDYRDLLLLYILSSRLDATTRQPTKTNFNASQSHQSGGRCSACSGTHLLHECATFRKMSIASRDKLVRNNSLCRNCLRHGHLAADCTSRFLCRSCKGKHHTMVCFRSESNTESKGSSLQGGNPNGSGEGTRIRETTSANLSGHRTSSVLLATAVVLVEDDNGVSHPARALLDSGSESNFVSENLMQLLQVQRRQADVSVQGIGQAVARVKHKANLLKSRISNSRYRMDFLVLPTVTADLPTSSVNVNGWKLPDVELADPTFFETRSVDMVLGIEHFFSFFMAGKRMQLGNGLPTFTETVFGWIATGAVNMYDQATRISCNVVATGGLEQIMARFWACEEIESAVIYSPEELRCEEHYVQTVERGNDGRYTVSLPQNENGFETVGESRDIAMRRLQSIERRHLREPELRQEYNKFMQEYRELGHMHKVHINPADDKKRCYLPHHPVVKQSSTTTKVRVVFDASCRTSTGRSLNDALLCGPVIQDDLRSLILRSRTRQIMLVADIEKMFRQIKVHPNDMPFQSILWRNSPDDEVETYELATVTYGTKPAPLLATRTLKQLAMDEGERFPQAAISLMHDVYMDDVLTGGANVSEVAELRRQLELCATSGGFCFRKWASNSSEVLLDVSPENLALKEEIGVDLDPDPAVRTLGLTWLPGRDVLKFHFNIADLEGVENLTKRKVLSSIAALFDPLGFIGAVMTSAKIFMQRIWCLKGADGKSVDWDQALPHQMAEDWRNFHEKLSLLNNLTISRCVIIPNATEIQLYVFTDASERAYGACAYFRSVDTDGRVKVSLLTSKSKIAPLKTQSIPRFELCGALHGAQLSEMVIKAVKFNPKVFFWSDSSCVLQWLKATPSTLTVFVGNRVSKIQQITEQHVWNHVPGTCNPADLISRGLSPGDIINNELWWEGPQWLKNDDSNWPNAPVKFNEDEVTKEFRREAVQCSAVEKEAFGRWYVKQFSTFSDMVRRTAYLRRYLKPIQKRTQAEGFLTTEELKEAEFIIIRHAQQEDLSEEWKALKKQQPVPRSSQLRFFNPMLSEDNLIRVGGRLRHSSEAENTKHPIVHPARHPITRMIIEHYHKCLLHASPQLLLATVRLKYWPLGGRNVTRNVVHQCQRCFRVKPKAIQQFMGELPAARVTVAAPFSRTGVDYFGPVYLRLAPRRPVSKGYVALFVCMTTKAVHFELVSDLSTERFIQALRRFTARRGKCSDIYSDNGTNFVGADNQLRKLLSSEAHKEKMAREYAGEGIKWHFNPAGAPHFGGLWEAAVRSAKHHFIRVLGDNPVNPEDFTTLLVQVEACLNSRPITSQSEDPNDLEPLTPGHFIIGKPIQQLPDPDFSKIPMNRLHYWQAVQKQLREFWKRWRTEYLTQLQGRAKRWQPPIKIAEGQLVVMREEGLPPARWKLARILQLHPGDDGVVRVVTLKTAKGSTTRPVEKICILPPVDSNEDYLVSPDQD
ncbi:uncharacterized protein LOC129737925 [Uranotaenia lowii]|uniref:uncharacterized protein LOC129737925 n=1 Tax=Uranotaenia lowii TaxID=190385 RepID=UPI00247A36E1|nr:uncharacterized protein LOC129737925 [Uranotaenia lowii]